MSGWLATLSALLVAFSVLALAHSYLLYPLSLHIWLRFSRHRPELPPPPEVWPRVAILVSAYNEQAGIAAKIRSFLQLDYPEERIELLIGDDASSDDTLARAQAAAAGSERIRLIPFARSGKATVINALMQQTDAEIFVLTDATSRHAPDSIARLARWLTRPEIGVAAASLIYEKPEAAPGSDTGEGLYWRLETFMRRAESDLGAAMQPSGACYALRREDARPIPVDSLADDLHLPLSVVAEGKRLIIDPDARVYEELAVDQATEFRRRVRIGTGSFQILSRFVRLLWPGHGRLWYSYVSHKVLRWLGPVWMLVSLLGCLPLLNSGIALGWFSIQLAGYAAVLVAWVFPALRARSRLLNLMYYFCAMNLALAAGGLVFLATDPTGRWEKA